MKMTPTRWLVDISLIYLIAGFVDIYVYKFAELEFIQMTWVFVMSLPLFVPPLSRWVGIKLIWKP